MTPSTAAKSMTPQEALELWLTVPRLPISPKERAALDAAENFIVPLHSLMPPGGDFELPVTMWGQPDKPPVLLMHGWGGNRGQMLGFVDPLLAAGFRVATFDAPAHGDLPGTIASGYQIAEALKAVVDRIGEPYAIVAHSLGTMAVTVALKKWLKVKKLVFSGPMRRLSDTLEPFLKSNRLPAEMADELKHATEAKFGPQVWEDTSLDLILPNVDIPALVFHDRDDEVTPYISGVAVARAWPSARLVTTHGLGHRGTLKDADVIRQTVEFVAAK